MKVYLNKPEREVRLYKPNRDDEFYEIWVVRPVLVGTCRRIATKRIRSDDGHEFKNTMDATRYIIESSEHRDMVDVLDDKQGRDSTQRITGVDLAARGWWPAFAMMRKLDPRSIEALQKVYELAPSEVAQLSGKAAE